MLRYAARTFAKYVPFNSFFCRRQRGGEDPEQGGVGAAHLVPQQVPQLPPEDRDGGGRGGVQQQQQYPPPPPPQLFRGDEIFISDQEEEEEENDELPPSWRHMEVQTDNAPQMESSGAGHPDYLEDEFCNIFPYAAAATTSSSKPSSSSSGYYDGGEYTEDEYDNDKEEEEEIEPSDLYYLQESVTHTSRAGRTVQVPPGMASRRQ